MYVEGDSPLTSFAPHNYRLTYQIIAPRRITPRERREVQRYLRNAVNRVTDALHARALGSSMESLPVNHTKRERCNQCGPVFCTCNAT